MIEYEELTWCPAVNVIPEDWHDISTGNLDVAITKLAEYHDNKVVDRLIEGDEQEAARYGLEPIDDGTIVVELVVVQDDESALAFITNTVHKGWKNSHFIYKDYFLNPEQWDYTADVDFASTKAALSFLRYLKRRAKDEDFDLDRIVNYYIHII